MSWLTNFVRPKLRALVSKKELPDKLWLKCPSCGQMLHHKAAVEALYVCGHCDHHMRIEPEERFRQLFDDGASTAIALPEVPLDPLKFRDEKRYADRLKEVRGRTGQADAVVVAHGLIGGHAAVMAVQSFKFLGGSMGMAAGEALIRAAEEAVTREAALIVVTAAGGARMQEGILSLMQMPRTTIAVQTVREKGLPYIVVLTDPTTGGVTASYAMLGDIAIAEPGALIGFAGPRVIENTIREQLPEGFQKAEYLLEHGMLDMVVHRHRLSETLARIIDMVTRPVQPSEAEPAPEPEPLALPPAELEIPEPEAAQDGPSAES
ncbi:MAG: acetyl-CoA carboxylase, carboxyltransferase subunit beta [Alphaproteobacteria bacterium]|jgi:acetyl-CoA carboxylase carboxyl transferase subunit beta|nr:acetyl-CoA carboxylase, carboxyltransferase subunit beta [Alphaproteobacteria bacterium]